MRLLAFCAALSSAESPKMQSHKSQVDTPRLLDLDAGMADVFSCCGTSRTVRPGMAEVNPGHAAPPHFVNRQAPMPIPRGGVSGGVPFGSSPAKPGGMLPMMPRPETYSYGHVMGREPEGFNDPILVGTPGRTQDGYPMPSTTPEAFTPAYSLMTMSPMTYTPATPQPVTPKPVVLAVQQVTTQNPRDLEPIIPPRGQPSATEIPQTVQAEPQLQNGPQQSARSPNPWEKRAVTLKRGVAGPFVGVLGIQFARDAVLLDSWAYKKRGPGYGGAFTVGSLTPGGPASLSGQIQVCEPPSPASPLSFSVVHTHTCTQRQGTRKVSTYYFTYTQSVHLLLDFMM